MTDRVTKPLSSSRSSILRKIYLKVYLCILARYSNPDYNIKPPSVASEMDNDDFWDEDEGFDDDEDDFD
jgi:hypothetical protein